MRPARHVPAASAGWPLLALLSLLTACSEPPAAAPAPPRHALAVAVVGSGVPLEHTAIGSVVSDERVDVASRLSGFIRDMPVREGDRVRRGEVLARIDGTEVESSIRQAEAALASAEASHRDATVDAARFQQLFDKGSVSDSELRKARLRQEAAGETANQARAARDSALAQRDYTQIRSPLDGVVVARLRQAGDLATPGMPLLALESASRLVFETTLTEGQLAGVRAGQAVTLHIDGMAQPLAGRVSRIVASADPVTRSFPVQIALPATRDLLPGMFGRAVFVLGASATPVVPRNALAERGGLRGVFVVDSTGRAGFRWLRTGREWPQRVEVLAGLDAGERIVLQPPSTLRDGDLVSANAATHRATPAP